MKQPPTDEEINASIEAGLRAIADGLDWSGLIAQAMACNPEPLKAALIQMAGEKHLYPSEVLDFLQLMQDNPTRRGPPKKDGKESLRAAAKAWKALLYRSAKDGISDFYTLSKHHNLAISANPERSLVNVKTAKRDEVFYAEKPTDFALSMMVEAGFGTSEDSLRDAIYPERQKKKNNKIITQRKKTK